MARDYHLAFWNLENLFAPEHHEDRIPWIAEAVGRDLAGWTQELFDRKLEQLARVIVQLNGGVGPDILGVCEVENRFVLMELTKKLNARLAGRAYGVVHADNMRDQRGIDTAFLYDANLFSFDENAIFSHFVMRRTGTRDILQATFRTQAAAEIVMLANHWPSRSGGAVESAGFRSVAGETLAYWHERILEEKANVGVPHVAVLALGDFNDDPHDNSMRYNARAWRERGDVERAEKACFYNLAWRYLSQKLVDRQGAPRSIDGTLYFNDDGNVFDQILVNRHLLTGAGAFLALEETAKIGAPPEMVDHRVGEGPVRFGLPKGNAALNVDEDGYSDHFPVSVIVREL